MLNEEIRGFEGMWALDSAGRAYRFVCLKEFYRLLGFGWVGGGLGVW